MASMEEKVLVTSAKKKASVRKKDQCSFRHESNDRAQQPEHTAASRITRSKCVEEEKVSEAKVTMGPFFHNRADI